MQVNEKVISSFSGKDVISYEIKNKNGFELKVLNYGAVLTDILVPDRNGNIENVILKYQDINVYEENPSYIGATLGRTAGRINVGQAVFQGETLTFNKNYGTHQGQGGNIGFNKVFWTGKTFINETSAGIEFSYLSKDGEEGYPGNLDVKITFTVTEDNEIKINYKGVSDKDTLVNISNHCYFNLSGDGKDSVLEHQLFIDSDKIVELQETQVPTGELLSVENTPFDFRQVKTVGKDIDADYPQLNLARGYDHPWVLNEGDGKKVHIYDEKSGRNMEIYTDQETVVIYTMNYKNAEPLFDGIAQEIRYGICFETQNPPIGENSCFIDNSTLKAGTEYNKTTLYKFYTK